MKLQNAVITQNDCHEYLQNTEYPFLYYCRSTSPKSDTDYTKEEREHIMKTKLTLHFINKEYYFQKVHLKEDTKLMVSNQFYNSKSHFQWSYIDEKIT